MRPHMALLMAGLLTFAVLAHANDTKNDLNGMAIIYSSSRKSGGHSYNPGVLTARQQRPSSHAVVPEGNSSTAQGAVPTNGPQQMRQKTSGNDALLANTQAKSVTDKSLAAPSEALASAQKQDSTTKPQLGTQPKEDASTMQPQGITKQQEEVQGTPGKDGPAGEASSTSKKSPAYRSKQHDSEHHNDEHHSYGSKGSDDDDDSSTDDEHEGDDSQAGCDDDEGCDGENNGGESYDSHGGSDDDSEADIADDDAESEEPKSGHDDDYPIPAFKVFRVSKPPTIRRRFVLAAPAELAPAFGSRQVAESTAADVDLFDRRGKHVADAYITATCSHVDYSATSFNALMTIEFTHGEYAGDELLAAGHVKWDGSSKRLQKDQLIVVGGSGRLVDAQGLVALKAGATAHDTNMEFDLRLPRDEATHGHWSYMGRQ